MQDPVTIATAFRVKCCTSLGDRVFVVGDAAELGHWTLPVPGRTDDTSGFELTTTPATYPVYESTAVHLPSGFYSFKFIILSADGSVTWEVGSNRWVSRPPRVLTAGSTEGVLFGWVGHCWLQHTDAHSLPLPPSPQPLLPMAGSTTSSRTRSLIAAYSSG